MTILNHTSHPIALKDATVTDPFWASRQELVRTQVIPYQWNALNDNVPGAAPSYCMHNFKAAAAQNAEHRKEGKAFVPPKYTFRGFEALPDDPKHPDPDKFYGFVFQDTDFSKWIEAVGYSLTHHPDAELEATADAAIDIVCAAQLDNGYLDTYYILNGMDRHFTNLKDHHELYCFGHLTEGAIAYYQATGKRKLLDAACRFADYIDSRFGLDDGKLRGYPGHEIAEMALVKLAETTGEQRYADLAEYFVRQRGQQPLYFELEDRRRAQEDGRNYEPREQNYAYYQADKPITEQKEALGHAVRAAYFYAGAADVARLTGDPDLLASCERLWRNIVDRKLYITGGIGATHMGESFSFDYDLPNDTAYSESCAAIALAFFARRMLEIQPKSEYADVMESALYNTTLAGMALDGKSFFYVNPLEVVPEACHRDERKAHVKPVRQKWFGCACCPPNIARIVEDVQQYAYTIGDDAATLYVHLYMGGAVHARLSGADVNLDVDCDMPWSGKGSVTVNFDAVHVSGESAETAESKESRKSKDATFTIALRLPAWAGGETASDAIAVRGRSDIARTVRDGYLYLTGVWHDGDVIDFDFPMPVHMVAANPLVREDAGKVAFVRGPLAYCAEGVDNGENLHLLHADTARIAADPSCVNVDHIVFHAGAAAQDEQGLGEVDAVDMPMTTLTIPAWREMESGAPTSALYHDWRPVERKATKATLIPYFAWANRGETEMTVFLRG